MVIVTDSPNSYGHDVKLLVEHHGATVRAMHPRLGEHQMRSKLSLLPVLLPNLFAYRSAWREGDDVVVISWYRRVLRGKLFSNGTMLPAQRMRPQPADTLVM